MRSPTLPLLIALGGTLSLPAAPQAWKRPESSSPAARTTRARLEIRRAPTDPTGFENLSQALWKRGERKRALRAATSLVDLGPEEPETLLRAGFLTLQLESPALAEDLFERARSARPDRPNAYRGLALARWARGQHPAAVRVVQEALEVDFPSAFGPIRQIFRGLGHEICDAWETALPPAAEEVGAALAAARTALGPRPGPPAPWSATLHWQTEADDADLLVQGPDGVVCSFRERSTPAGLHLLADVSQGLGPERIELRPDAAGSPPTPQPSRGAGFRIGIQDTRPGGTRTLRGVVTIRTPSLTPRPEFEIVPFVLTPPEDPEAPPPVLEIARGTLPTPSAPGEEP